MIKCIVFDFDGVLVDSNAIKHDAYFKIFSSLGNTREAVETCLATRPDDDRYQIIECILRRLEALGILIDDESIRERLAFYAGKYNQICESGTITCRETPGATESLRRLSQHYVLYINSTTVEEPLRRVIQQRGWEGYFRKVLGSPRTKSGNLSFIMQNEHVDGGQLVFVGDGQRDLKAARSAGCHFIGVRNAFNDFDLQDLIILDDLRGLEGIIHEY